MDQHPAEDDDGGFVAEENELRASSPEKPAENHLLYRQRPHPTPSIRSALHHPHKLHRKDGGDLAATEAERGNKISIAQSPAPLRRPHQEHQRSPDRRICKHKPPEARRFRQPWPRQGEGRAPVPLFPSNAATSTSPAPPEEPTLLSTRVRRGSEVPPLSSHRNSSRRGRRPSIRPSAERGKEGGSLFASPTTVARGRGK